MVQREDLTITQGSDFGVRLLLVDSESGLPIDLTGCSLAMQVRPSLRSSMVLFEATTGNGGLLIGPYQDTTGAGVVDLIISAAATERLVFSKAVYDVELTTESERQRVLEGNVLVAFEVTR